MEKDSKIRVCKNKRCQKVLPIDYKYNKCEACRNKTAYTIKKTLKTGAKIGGALLSILIIVLTRGKAKPKI